MNGVCVKFVGWLNIVKLEGVGYLMFDEDRAKVRSKMVRLYKLHFIKFIRHNTPQ